MGDTTKIEWAQSTWNPTTGCDRVSPGCDHCYAMTLAPRLKAMGSPRYQNDGDPRTSGPGFGITMHPAALDQPLRWTKPRRIFVNSMSDLFHDGVSDEFIARVFAAMACAPQHTFQVLTKRHGRMRSLLSSDRFQRYVYRAINNRPTRERVDIAGILPLPNVWLGVSVENQQWADIRIPALLDTPAEVRFLSCEPLLGPVTIKSGLRCRVCQTSHKFSKTPCDPLTPARFRTPKRTIGGDIDWVIVGGESGPGARPMHPGWARSLRDQCQAAGVPFLFKQWGEWRAERDAVSVLRGSEAAAFLDVDGTLRPLVNGIPEQPPRARGDAFTMRRLGKKRAGRELDGRTWDEFPEAVTVR